MVEEYSGRDESEEDSGRLGGYAPVYDEVSMVPFPGDIRSASLSALWSGAVAGLAMGLTMMILFAAIGLSPWLPFKLIAIPIVGSVAVIGGVEAVVRGFLLHIIVSVIVAVVFAVVLVSLTGRVGSWVGATSGIIYGLIVWVVAQYIVLPVTYPLIAAGLVPWVFGFSHIVYGLVLGILPTQYRVTREEYETALLAP